MTALANIQTEYKYSLQDLGSTLESVNATATTAVRDAAITQAFNWYCRRIPQIKCASVANVSTGYYTVPTDWTQQSRIVSVEYPLDQSPPTYLIPYGPNPDVRMARTTTGMRYYIDPNPAGTFRLTYTCDHTLTASASTLDSRHEAVIGRMAAAIACAEFSARYANSVSNNLDAVNYRSKAQEFETARKMLIAQAETEIRRDEASIAYQTDPAALKKGWK